jgi:hypothetical protein
MTVEDIRLIAIISLQYRSFSIFIINFNNIDPYLSNE